MRARFPQSRHGLGGKEGAPSCGSSGIANVTEGQLRENPVYRQGYGLTDREMDVLVLLLAGYNAADIAEMLSISTNR